MINTQEIIDLNSYIRISTIREDFEHSCLFVNDYDGIQKIDVMLPQNIIFETSNLKNRFFERLQLEDINHTVINCLQSVETFESSMIDAHGMVVFDNVCACRNNEILDMVMSYKNKKMLVC